MAEKNVGSFIVTVQSNVAREDIKRVESEYIRQFKEISEKCTGVMNGNIGRSLENGNQTPVLSATMIGINTALDADCEKTGCELDELLQKANEVSTAALEFGNSINPAEVLFIKSAAMQLGLETHDLQNHMLRFGVMQSQNDPVLKNFKSGNLMQDFSGFTTALKDTNYQQTVQYTPHVLEQVSADKTHILVNGGQKVGKNDHILKTFTTNRTYQGQNIVGVQDKSEILAFQNKINELKNLIDINSLQNNAKSMQKQLHEFLELMQTKTLLAIENALKGVSEVLGDKKGVLGGLLTTLDEKVVGGKALFYQTGEEVFDKNTKLGRLGVWSNDNEGL